MSLLNSTYTVETAHAEAMHDDVDRGFDSAHANMSCCVVNNNLEISILGTKTVSDDDGDFQYIASISRPFQLYGVDLLISKSHQSILKDRPPKNFLNNKVNLRL